MEYFPQYLVKNLPKIKLNIENEMENGFELRKFCKYFLVSDILVVRYCLWKIRVLYVDLNKSNNVI